MSRILSKSFVYTSSHETDIGKRFKRMAEAQRKMLRDWDLALEEYADREAARKAAVVQPLRKGAK